MALPEPTTVSPGRLLLVYTRYGRVHTMGANYLANKLPASGTEATATATSWANIAAELFSSDTTFTGWRVTNLANETLAAGNFASPIPGVGGHGLGMFSYTTTFLGKGQAASIGIQEGNTRVVLFNGDSQNPTSGQKRRNLNASTAQVDFAQFLENSTEIWADKYGQKAAVLGYVTVQFNSHEQDIMGN